MIDKGLLALQRCDELEELIHKKSKGSSGGDTPSDSGGGAEYIEKENLTKITFEDRKSLGNLTFATDICAFGAGSTAFFIEGKLKSSVATSYTIKIYINQYLTKDVELKSVETEHSCF